MSFSSNWRGAVWRLIRPQSIVECIVATMRIATNKLCSIKRLAENEPTIATGQQYTTVRISLSDISEQPEHTADGVVYRYAVRNLPEGAITIGKSADGKTALRHINFYEKDGLYVFNTDPTAFGVVSSRGGDHCTFCVCVGKSAYVEHQDTFGEYSGATHDATVSCIAKESKELATINGLSGAVLALACGNSTASVDSAVHKYWSEGFDLYAVAGGELLRSLGGAGKSVKSTIAAGETLTDIVADFVVISSPKDRKAVWVDSDESCSKIPNWASKAYPLLANAGTMDAVRSVMQSYDQYTYDTTNSPNDKGTQMLLKRYNTTGPSLQLTQKIVVSVSGCDIDESTRVVIVCSDSKYATAERRPEESALSFILRAARVGSVAVIDELLKTSTSIYALSNYAKYPTRRLQAGMYITSILLIGGSENDQSGTILCEKKISPVTVKSGESIAVRLEFN